MNKLTYKIKIIFISVFAIGLSIFFGGIEYDSMKLSGRLVYSSGGNQIDLIKLDGFEIDNIGPISSDDYINYFALLSDNLILFESCAWSRKQNCILMKFDINAKKVSVLRSGYLPTYISEAQKLLFYDLDEKSGQKWLYIADLKNPFISKQIAKAPADRILPNGLKYPLTTQPVQISNDEIIFVGEDSALWIFQISSAKLRSTGIKESIPHLWRKRTQQLICYDLKTQEFYQISLMTRHIEKLPQLKGAYGLVYLPNDDAIIYGKSHTNMLISEKYDMFVYSFDSKKEIKLRDNISISSGLWLPPNP